MYDIRRKPKESAPSFDPVTRLAGAFLLTAYLYREEKFTIALEDVQTTDPKQLDDLLGLLPEHEQQAVRAVAERIWAWLQV